MGYRMTRVRRRDGTGPRADPASHLVRMLRPLITFSGCVLVVACLYWGQAILIPIALAVLITFLLDAVVLELALHLGEQSHVRPHSI
jgi:predicted PurR-regulated permease PerM